MNWILSGSLYGSFQSMRLMRYGETRTLIGAWPKPSVASAMNSGEVRSRSASRSLSGRVMLFFACQWWSRNCSSVTSR
ncbi:hypothetical protein D3C83_110460 [compost metagenome]